MRLTLILILGTTACTATLSSSEDPVLRIEPSNATVTIVDGKPVVQSFTATLDGIDVTAETKFALAEAAYGNWQDGALNLAGNRVGITQVVATYDDLQSTAALRVDARTTLVEAGATDFDIASMNLRCTTQLVYPVENAVLPKNGGLELAWSDSNKRTFHVSLDSEFAHVDIITPNQSFSALPSAVWDQLATSDSIEARVSAAGCTSTPVTFRVTDQALTGQVFYSADGAGIVRQDVSRSRAPQRLEVPASFCRDCAVTRTGSHFAVMQDNGDTAIFDFTTKRVMKPLKWESVTFTADPTKLIIEQAGQLHLIDDAGNDLATLPGTLSASDPELSPDDGMLTYVESVGRDYSIIVRTHDSETHAVGEPFEVVPPELGVLTLWPTWSPDGQWLAYTRITEDDNGDKLAAIWIVSVDGRETLQATELTRKTTIVPRWAPGAQTVDGEKMFYLTFDADATHGRSQIWMAAFFPGLRTVQPATRLPFQSGSTSNRIAHWASPVELR